MAFQQTVSLKQGFGVVGGIYADSPSRVETFNILSGDPANNIFGRGFTVLSEGVAQAGGTGIFAGFLVNTKLNASTGTVSGGPLASTLTLPNNVVAEFLTMGIITVALPSAANIGDYVYYNTATGALTTQAPGSAPAVGTAFAHAVVDYFTVTQAGLAVIKVTTVPTNV
jgi:hypothetical protein